MNEKEYIKKLEGKSLSDSDLKALFNSNAKILTYTELADVNDIEELLYPYDACIILYLTKRNYGHWTCVFRRGKYINFFDSYGLKPDFELKWVPSYLRVETKQVKPHLTYLLYKATYDGYNIEYNNYALQQKSSYDHHIATCGRHVAVRLMFKHLSPDEYAELILNSNYTPDQLVTILTCFI